MTALQTIAEHLTRHRQTVTCAESCTGGLLAAALTELPGSSAFFDRGFITYSDKAKQQVLNVNANTLRHYGAVSEETVVRAIDAMRDAGRTVIVIAHRAAMMEAADAIIDVRSAADEEARA